MGNCFRYIHGAADTAGDKDAAIGDISVQIVRPRKKTGFGQAQVKQSGQMLSVLAGLDPNGQHHQVKRFFKLPPAAAVKKRQAQPVVVSFKNIAGDGPNQIDVLRQCLIICLEIAAEGLDIDIEKRDLRAGLSFFYQHRHTQRGGRPTARDRILASELGASAVGALLEGESGKMVGRVNSEIVLTPLRETWTKKKPLDQRLYELALTLAA